MISPSDLYTVAEAAERIGVPGRTLRRWCETGKAVPLKRFGNGQAIFDVDEVERLRSDRVEELRRKLALADHAA